MAVATDNDPDLIAALPELLRSDPDASVRLAALKRLDDYEFWRERSHERCRANRLAPHRTHRLSDATLLGFQGMCPLSPVASRNSKRSVRTNWRKVASTATHRELRTDALSRISKTAFLGERALNDPHAALRMKALERIVDASAPRTHRRTCAQDRQNHQPCRTRARRGHAHRTRRQENNRRSCAGIVRAHRSGNAHGGFTIVAHICAAIEQEWLALGSAYSSRHCSRGTSARGRSSSRLRRSKKVEMPSGRNLTVAITSV